jgi:hypothetical protein
MPGVPMIPRAGLLSVCFLVQLGLIKNPWE